MIVSDDGDTVRLDGVCRGALPINKTGADYRLRMTNTEGGKFVVDCTFRKAPVSTGSLNGRSGSFATPRNKAVRRRGCTTCLGERSMTKAKRLSL